MTGEHVVHPLRHHLLLVEETPSRVGDRQSHPRCTPALWTPTWAISPSRSSPCPAPTADNLLVLYFRADAEMYASLERLAEAGHAPVDAENPYWAGAGAFTFEDPDGWRVVLVPRPVF